MTVGLVGSVGSVVERVIYPEQTCIVTHQTHQTHQTHPTDQTYPTDQ